MILGKRHIATGLVVVLAHLWTVQMFSRIGRGPGPTIENPSMEVSVVDGFATPAVKTKPVPLTAPAPAPPPTAQDVIAPPPPDPVATLVEAMVQADLPPPVFDPSPPVQTAAPGAASAADGVQCRTTEDLQAALQTDPAVQAALRRIPKTERSVANAVKVWDREWSPPEALGGRPDDDPVKTVALTVLRAAPPACLDQPLAGPRLVMIASYDTTAIMAFGSGAWRWKDAIPPDAPQDILRGIFAIFPKPSDD